MAQGAIPSILRAFKNWWLFAVVGILFILLGVWVLNNKLESYVGLSLFFGLSILFSGVSEMVFSLSNRDHLDGWGWYLTGGIFSLIMGIILLMFPGLTMVTLPIFLGFWLLFRGGSLISFSFDIRDLGASAWWWMLLGGILVGAFGLLVLFRPAVGGMTIIYYTGFSFILLGLLLVFFGLKLNSVKNHVKDRLAPQ
ncbi:DUF308 domain-containing protein [Pontibacter sp. G13]|uniref:HdeD family acid-resistance protein n=1 Tax=Pontibacter sp. G13 TaxID=3074898 RepID=UPI002889CF18|nr:DUF308 domain-containing protein [Pontibacter sp. G13]WNJ19934.1 DUF308 domain-containing protein [Pontibacter sp. G13]